MIREVTRLIAVLSCVGIILFAFAQSASAASGVPRIMNYQGRLMNAGGTLLGGSGTDYCVKFSLYDDATVGGPDTKLWPTGSPATMTVVVRNGIFNAGVGDTNVGGDTLDFNFEDTDAAYLNVEVATKVGATCAPGDGAESFENLSPRQRVTASGYAINSATLGGQAGSYYLANSFSTTSATVFTNSYVHSSTTIPKTYSSNTFIGVNAFADITVVNATSSTLNVSGTFSGAGLTSCSGSNDKLVWNSTTRLFGCDTDLSGSGGADGNWTFFNNTGIRPATTSNQVLVGGTATTSLAKFEAQGGAKFDNATSTSLQTTVFGLGSDYFTSLAGTGLQNIAGVLTLNTAGDWTGLLDGQEGSYYTANSFSTSSAAYFSSNGLAFSTTSAAYYASQNPGASFSTTSANFWSSLGFGHSTSSFAYDLSTYDNGFFFSTTSVNYWETTQSRWATTSAAYFAANGLAFSTSSANFYSSVGLAFSSSSASYFLSQNGAPFSTTSADYYVNASTTIPKTYSNNTFTGTNDFQDTTATNATSTTSFATTASSSNLFSSVANIGSLITSVFTGNVLTAVNATTTSLSTGIASTSNLVVSGIQDSMLYTGPGGIVAGATVSGPLSFSAGTLSIQTASAAQAGALSAGDYSSFNNRLSTSSLGLFDKGYFFSTTSASVFSANGLSFSTTSTDFWRSVNNFFSTSSASHFSALGLAFSTTSASYFLGQNLGAAFSTTSASNFAAVGLAFSTTSEDYYMNASTTVPTTYKNNTFTGVNSFANISMVGATSTSFFSNLFSSLRGVFGSFSATTTNATSTIAGSLLIGTSSGSYKVSVLGNTTGATGATGTAIMAISNDDNTLSSGNNVLRLNIRTPYATACTSATTCPRFTEYFAGVPSGSDTGGRGVGSLRLSTAGTGITQTSGSADFAEYMLLSESADVGDIVSLNSDGEYRKATAGESLIGVISDNPAFVGNGNLEGQPNAYIVGFAGVIQTTVSDANGSISAGDLIAASDVPGVGVKLTESGYALGQALQSYSGPGEGTITILVMPKFVDASIALESYGGGASGDSGYWSLSTSTNTVSLASSTNSVEIQGNASTSNLVVSNGFTFGKATGVLRSVAGVVTSTLVNLATDVTGVLGISNGGTGTSTAPAYGQILVGNNVGGYDFVATSSLGNASGAAVWGAITGTLSAQTDLQNALNQKFSLSQWYATTTDALNEGVTNQYFTTNRVAGVLSATTTDALAQGDVNKYYDDGLVQTYLSAMNKGFFFSTTSASNFASVGLAFSTTSANTFAAAGLGFSTTSASFFLSQNGGGASFSTTSAAYHLSTYDKGYFFSTTSVSYWDSTQFRWATTSTDAWFATKSTSDLPEGTNLYYTPARVAGIIAGTTTDALAQGDVNKYYSNGLVDAHVGASTTIPKTFTNNTFTGVNSFGNISASGATTTSLSTGIASTSNLVVSNIQNSMLYTGAGGVVTGATISGPLSFSAGTLSITQAGAGTDGFLASGDFSSFNSRLSTTSLGLFDKGYFFSTTSANVFSAAGLSFSTTSTDYWKSINNFFSTTSASHFSSLGLAFSTTSASYFLGQNLGNAFSTTSASNFAAVGLAFSTTSANTFAAAGLGFSTTSAAYYASQNPGASFSTSSALYFSSLGLSFSTSSTDYWRSVNNFFSTTSASHFSSLGLAFSTTSASYFLGQNLGNAFSTTSATHFVHSSTTIPKTYTNNTFTGSNDFANISATNATTTTLFSGFSSSTETRANTASFGSATIGSLTTTATSTGSNGFDITDGCFSIDGICLSSEGGGDPSGVLIAIQTFSVVGTTTYTPSAGATSAQVIVTGGGGGGGGADSDGTTVEVPAGGAGAGATAFLHVDLTATTSVQVVVGAGGTGGTAAAGGTGLTGGHSSFGPALGRAGGGNGGVGAVSADTTAAPRTLAGGAGGAATVGNVQVAGGNGQDGNAQAGNTAFGGTGGSSYWGGGGDGGAVVVTATQSAGSNANAYGAGGGGAALADTATGAAGGNGAAGIVVVYEYGPFQGTMGVTNGGTGLSSGPSYGQLLMGDGAGGYVLVATSSIGLATTTDSLTEGVVNKYYTDERVNSYVGASTTIAKSFTANIFTALQTFANAIFSNATSTNVAATGVASSTNLVASNSFTFGKVTGILKATAGAVVAALVDLTNDVTGILGITNGGTGTSTAPTKGQLLIGNAIGGYDLVATSTLGVNFGDTTGILGETRGGTNQTSYAVGDILFATGINTLARLPAGTNGTVLKVAGGLPSWGTDLQSGGGGGGSGLFSTTTDSLAIFPSNPAYVVVVGNSATTTQNNAFEVTGSSYFSGNVGIATTSAGSILSIGNVANFSSSGSTLYSKLNLIDVEATGDSLFSNVVAATLAAANVGANSLSAGTTATTTIQGDATGTSTIQGFINVTGTNSTSTFSGNLQALSIRLTATSTAAGINMESGCYAINGVCTVQSLTATNTSLTVSPGNGAVGISLNLSNPNLWTGLQQFRNASSSLQEAAHFYARTIQSTSTNALVLQSNFSSTAGLTFGSTSTPQVLAVDTINNRVTLGTGGGTPSLLVLDNKNTPGDPTGTAGAQYYNSSASEFRCFIGSWMACGGQAASSTGNVQYKNVDGSFTANAGFTWSIPSAGLVLTGASTTQTTNLLTIASSSGRTMFGVNGMGVMTLSSTTDPTTPASGEINIYAKDVAGRMLPKWIGPAGVDTSFQAGFFSNSIAMLAPSTGAAMTTFGMLNTTVGTISTPALATTNLHTSMRQSRVTSAAGANSAAELRNASGMVWRGNAAGMGGWFYSARFAVNTTVANQRLIMGLMASTTAIAVTQPPVNSKDIVAVGWDSADTNLQIYHNDVGGAATKVDLGASYPANNTTAVYEFTMFAPPNGSQITVRVQRLDTNISTTTTLTTNLPTATTFLTAHEYMNNGGTAQAVAFDLMRVYVESDN